MKFPIWLKTILEILFSPLFFFMQWLAKENILFTTVKEGTVKAIMKGDSLERFIMSFAGYHLNDPALGKSRYLETFVDDMDEVISKKTNEIKKVEKIVPKWEVLYHGKTSKEGGNKYRFGEEKENDNKYDRGKKERERENEDDYYDDRPFILKYLGLHWIGWPWAYRVYIYPFEWNETYTQKETGKERVLPRGEATDFIYVADFTYAIKTDGAETKDRIPTDELTLVTIAIRNPYRALFSGEDWMQRITAAINRHVRNFVASKGYDELISLPQKEGSGPGSATKTEKLWAKEFSGPIIRLTEFLPDENKNSPHPRGLHERYGVVIRTGDLQTVEIAGTDEAKRKLQEAATESYAAVQEARAIKTRGKASAKVIKITGKKEASALRKRLEVIKEYGPAGIALAGYDAIQESSKNPGSQVIWANNPLTELLKSKEGGGTS